MRISHLGTGLLAHGLLKTSVRDVDLVSAMDRIPGWSEEPLSPLVSGGATYSRSGPFPRSMLEAELPWGYPKMDPGKMRKLMGGYQRGYQSDPSWVRDWATYEQELKSERRAGTLSPEEARTVPGDLKTARRNRNVYQGEDPLKPGSEYQRLRKAYVADPSRGEGLPRSAKYTMTFDPNIKERITVPVPTKDYFGRAVPEQHRKALQATALMHETSERKVLRRAGQQSAGGTQGLFPGWTHANMQDVLIPESNMVARVEGASAKGIKNIYKGMRGATGEAKDMEGLIQRWSGGKIPFTYGETRLNRSARKALGQWLGKEVTRFR